MPDSKKTILIVDDDKSILRVFARLLQKRGYTVTTVETGKEAIGQIGQNHFDAALIDVRLPDMEGTEILPLLQKTSPKTVRIIFTGSPDLATLGNGGAQKDIDAFLIKPVKPEVLLDILNEKLNARRIAS